MNRVRAAVLAAALAVTGCAGRRAASEPAREPSPQPWSYTGRTGPAQWGTLRPEWAVAAAGREQSPVNIETGKTTSTPLPALELQYGESRLTLVNNGHTIELPYDAGSSMRLDGIRYRLVQLHFHAPSEHTINGRHAPMEMHLVHRDDQGNLAVLAVLIEQGSEHEAYEPLLGRLPQAPGEQTAAGKVKVNAERMLPRSRRYYRYRGSLTTPPCTEGVTWLLLQEPVRLAAGQIERFTSIYRNTNRPVQPLNDRVVLQGR